MKQELIMKFKNLLKEQRESVSSSRNLSDRVSVLQENEMLETTDLAATELGMESWIRLCRSETLFLKKIDATLQRIEDGEFGKCEECDEDIEFSRLKIRPTLSICAQCQEKADDVERHYANKIVKRKPTAKRWHSDDLRSSRNWNVKVR
jgi:DnaK suppressor protein